MIIPYARLEYGDAALLMEAAEFYATHCPEGALTGNNESKLLLAAKVLSDMALENDAIDLRPWNEKDDGDFDPIAVAVDEAVSAYSRKNPEQDRAVWLSVANEIGVGAFRDKMRQMEAHLRDAALAGLAIYNKAAYFQGLLNRYTEHHGNSTKGASCTQ